MIKATRMRQMERALYFCSILLIGGQSAWYVSRRIAIMACEDGLDDALMRLVSQIHKHPETRCSPLDLLGAVAAINLRPNWWGNAFGRQMIAGCLREDDCDLSAYETAGALEDLMLACLFSQPSLDSWVLGSAAKSKLEAVFGWTLSDTHDWLIRQARKHAAGPWQQELVTAFGDMTPDITRFGDENWNYNFRYFLAMGRNPDRQELGDLQVAVKGLRPHLETVYGVAADDLERGCVHVPSWAYDGIHLRGTPFGWCDRRFAGDLDAFASCIGMAEHYGRVDPRDQALSEAFMVPMDGLVLGNEHLDRLLGDGGSDGIRADIQPDSD